MILVVSLIPHIEVFRLLAVTVEVIASVGNSGMATAVVLERVVVFFAGVAVHEVIRKVQLANEPVSLAASSRTVRVQVPLTLSP